MVQCGAAQPAATTASRSYHGGHVLLFLFAHTGYTVVAVCFCSCCIIFIAAALPFAWKNSWASTHL